MTGAEIMAATLAAHGITTVYGLPGEENIDMVAALAERGVRLVVTRHEQHAAFMAATRGRLTGKPAVCLATLGPGATNLFTGIAHAQLGGMPLVAITGQKPLRDNDEGSFQIVDVVAAATPLTKSAVQVRDTRDVASALSAAIQTAGAPRAGACLVEIPEDVAADAAPSTDPVVLAAPRRLADEAAVELAGRMLAGAARPVVLASSGAQACAEALAAFAGQTGIGVLTTQMGMGAIPADHPRALGTLGIHRPDYAHLAMYDADVAVVVGYDPVEHPPLSWNRKGAIEIIHVAAHGPSPERGFQPAAAVVGDPGDALGRLAAGQPTRSTARHDRMRAVVRDLLEAERRAESPDISPLEVVDAVRGALRRDGIVALDNGAYKIWFARHFPAYGPNTILLDNALATMGAGLSAGMTASMLHPDRRVVVVTGDGGFLMNLQDLETAVRLGVDLTVVVVRDDAYGFIAWEQEEQGRERRSVDLTNPDLVQLAAAFGAVGLRVESREELASTLETACGTEGVTVVDCPLDYTINDLLDTDMYERALVAMQEE